VNGSCQCPTGQHLCADGSCQECCSDSQCAVPERCCSGTCADLDGDDANCGACGHVCPADHTCGNNGRCNCPVGQVEDANGTCVCSTTCFGQPCCDGYYCNFGACLACEPTGGSCENSGDPGHPMDQACCSGTCNPTTLTCV
jgi:hypothetical protein